MMASDRIKAHVDRLLGEADQAVVDHDWALANELAQSILSLDADNADPKAFIGLSAPHLGATLENRRGLRPLYRQRNQLPQSVRPSPPFLATTLRGLTSVAETYRYRVVAHVGPF
jgi:hypothetical protein